jgi:hypothetical protein
MVLTLLKHYYWELLLLSATAAYNLCGSPLWIKTTNIPTDAVPAQPTTDGNILRVNHPNTPARRGPPPTEPPATSFLDFITSLTEWKTELLVGLVSLEMHDSLGTHLTQGDHLFLCSDGGSKENWLLWLGHCQHDTNTMGMPWYHIRVVLKLF